MYNIFRTVLSLDKQKDALRTLDSNFKGAVFAYLGQALLWNQQSAQNYTLNICKERFMLNQRVFYFSKDSYLIEEMNHHLSALFSNGIVNRLISNYANVAFMSPQKIDLGPKPINLENMSGLFYVWIALLFFSILMFVTEIVHFRVTRFKS